MTDLGAGRRPGFKTQEDAMLGTRKIGKRNALHQCHAGKGKSRVKGLDREIESH